MMAGQLITSEQVTEIEALAQRIGVDIDSESVVMATERVGGSSAPYAYLLLTRSQALALIMLMSTYIRARERDHAQV